MDKKSKKSTVEEFKDYHSTKSKKSEMPTQEQVKAKPKKKGILQKIKDYILQNDFVNEDNQAASPIIKNHWQNRDRYEFGHNPHDFCDPHFEEYYGWGVSNFEDEYQYYRFMQNKYNKKDKNKEDEDVIEI